MFADVSGFTPMTQALMKEGHEGAEILATILNTVFDRMVNAVYERGGFISTFGGDAFTAIFPLKRELMSAETFALHVFVCGEKIQAIFRRYGLQKTPFGEFTLQVKVGISKGDVHWGIVGKEDNVYFFRGDAADGCAAAEHHADEGDIIFDERVAQILKETPRTPGLSSVEGSERAWHVVEAVQIEAGYYRLQKIPRSVRQQLTLPKLPPRPRLRKGIVARFVPDALINFKELGEFRSVVPIFISFEGISSTHELDDWMYIVIKNITIYAGYFNRLAFGDKGAVILCGFGAPVAHEDEVDRALNCILAIKEDLKGFKSLAGLKFRVGITYGIAYAGIAGGRKRCEYTYHGEVVNLAARFMMKADWGEIFVSRALRSKTLQFNFKHKGDFQYKGIAEPVSTHELISRKPGVRHKLFMGAMIGRRAELQQLQDFGVPLFEHTFAGLAYIFGEAGMGKSRLSYALLEEWSERYEITWFNCPADQILRKPFNPFSSFFMRYFEQSPDSPETDNKRRFEERYQALVDALSPLEEGNPPLTPPRRGIETEDDTIGVDSPPGRGEGWVSSILKELIRTKSIIGAQIGLFWKDSLWEQLDAKGKYENTLYAIKNFFLAHSLLQPVVIELEDGHWIDSDSFALLEVLTRNVADYPLLLLSTLRYNDDGTKMTFNLQGVKTLEIDLRDLAAEDVKGCAEGELDGTISDELQTLLVQRTRGNPFYVQQMVLYFVENTIIALQENRWRLIADTLELPDTINAVLIARIDRLAQQVKELVKVAAVIGREFDVLLLSAVLKRDVVYQVKVVEKSQIWDELQELQYIFKHALIRDTAYQMQLRARLRELHQLTAGAMETMYAEKLAERYADLAFHYEKAEISDKAINYLEKAGDQAKARYQNQQAIGFYDRLLLNLKGYATLVAEDLSGLEIDTLLKKGEILELIGEWQECQRVGEDALRLAEQINDEGRMGQAHLRLGIIFRGTGHYEQAMGSFGQAMDLFETAYAQAGIGRTLGDMGMVHDYRGDYDLALGCYEQAFKISEELGDTLGMAKNANTMGIVYANKGNYTTALTWYHKSVQICEALGEKLEWSKVLNNIGWCHVLQNDYEVALAYYNQSLTISEELGDRFGVAKNALNMAIAYSEKGNYNTAMTWFQKSLQIREELGYKRGIVSILNNIGENSRLQGDYEVAMAYYEQALPIAEALGEKLQIGIVFGNIGHMYNAKGVYEMAIASYDRAISIFQVLESKHFLSEYTLGKAEVIYALQRYEDAQAVNAEGLRFAEEVNDNEYMFKGQVLSAKVDFALGNEDVPFRLEGMLQQTEDDAELAALHYELWKMTHSEKHRQAALNFYQTLYATTPNIEYKTRMEEMENYRNEE